MDQSASERKDRYLKLPADIILSKEGMGIVSQSQLSISKMKNHTGAVKEGIGASCINAQTLQKMVMNSYVEEIYVQQPQLLALRNELISTNNLVVYAILYKKLTPSISDKLFQSPIVKDFNRKNPAFAIQGGEIRVAAIRGRKENLGEPSKRERMLNSVYGIPSVE